MKVDELEPLLPDKAGTKMPFVNILRFVMLLIPRIHLLYASRSAVVDSRVEAVSTCSISPDRICCLMNTPLVAVHYQDTAGKEISENRCRWVGLVFHLYSRIVH